MITREKLLRSKEFWMVKIQNQLFSMLEKHLEKNKMTRTEFAEKLGVSKGYVSQIMNGDFNHRLSKLVELSLAVGQVPMITFKSLDKVILEDNVKRSMLNDEFDVVKMYQSGSFSIGTKIKSNTLSVDIGKGEKEYISSKQIDFIPDESNLVQVDS